MIKDRQLYNILRREKGIKLTQIADVIGISHATLSRYETGVRDPKQSTIQKYKDYIDNYKDI
ncbi:hypothetical protein GCM10028778_22570 [Barrientosiimonas marina]